MAGDKQGRRNSESGSVAIVGMACVFADAPDLDAFWRNIVSGHDAIKETPPQRWDPKDFYSPDPRQDGKVYCRRGGYLEPSIRFDPSAYGIMPKAAIGGEPDQFLALEMARRALADAGYDGGSFPQRQGAEMILGKGNYSGIGMAAILQRIIITQQTLQILQRLHPEYTAEELEAIDRELRASLPSYHADNAASLIPNLSAGRTSNRLDLMGGNFTVDAACASSLIAAEIGMQDLLRGACDLALVGGIHIFTHVGLLSIFCLLQALSPTERISPFGAEADGTLPGEGCGLVVLKRKEDALRDGNRIYACLRGLGTSSDGRVKSVIAPSVKGQILALSRAYEEAGIDPASIEMVEAHGTGTPVGDPAEIEALRAVFGPRGNGPPRCALGSVKSMIGHAMPAAGIAGLIKAALSLYHKILPPTLHCDQPNPKLKLEETPFYLNTTTRPWIHGHESHPRRAAVSAFGFGGVNAHAVLEEAPPDPQARDNPLDWDTEVILLRAQNRAEIRRRGAELRRYLDSAPELRLADLAFTLNTDAEAAPLCLAIVAQSVQELKGKLDEALKRLGDPKRRQIKDRSGIYYSDDPLGPRGKVAFLYPGEGSPYVGMFADLCLNFPEARWVFDLADRASIRNGEQALPSLYFFPHASLLKESPQAFADREWATVYSRVGVWLGDMAMHRIIQGLQIQPDCLAGHSAGEWPAMAAAGVLDVEEILPRLPELRRLGTILAEGDWPEAAMLAVAAGREKVEPLIRETGGSAQVTNDNCPHQVVVAGPKEDVERLAHSLKSHGLFCEALPFNRGYHTPLVAGVLEPDRAFISSLTIRPPRLSLYSCATGEPYPSDSQRIIDLAVETWIRPVEFRRMIEAMYAEGARVFIEVGPRGNLTAFADDILRNRERLTVPSNVERRSGLTQINHLTGLLSAHGVAFQPGFLYARRRVRRLSFVVEQDFPSPKAERILEMPVTFPMMRLAEREAAPSRPKEPPAPGALSATSEFSALPSLPGSLTGVRAEGEVDQVMHAHLETMDRFLQVQRSVMKQFLECDGDGSNEAPGVEGAAIATQSGRAPTEAPSSAPLVPPPPFVLAQTVVRKEEGRVLEARCVVDPREALYLRDHTFGHEVSEADPTLRALMVLPMTFGLEMMAEAACFLDAGRTLIEVKHVRAARWIMLNEGQPVELRLRAERRKPDEVHVALFQETDEQRHDSDKAVPAMEATAVFADRFPDPPDPEPFALLQERPARHTARELYDQGLMFHGPLFQGVSAIESMGEDGIRGRIKALAREGLLRSHARPQWAIDPVLIDSAGQLLGYWALESVRGKTAVFPVGLSRLRLFGPTPQAGEDVDCRIRIRNVSPQDVRANMTLADPQGRARLAIEGWMDWRFHMSERFSGLWRRPKGSELSPPWPAAEALLNAEGQVGGAACCRLEVVYGEDEALWFQVWAHLVLSRREREIFETLKRSAGPRTQWLLGRTAAKDAARRWLERRHGLKVCPADVEIVAEPGKAPTAGGAWAHEIGGPLNISLAHTEGFAVAAAAQGVPIGLDVERARERDGGFERAAFSEKERALLDQVGQSERAEWVARLWCAKEALGKALGQGLAGGPRQIEILQANPGGEAHVRARGALAEACPGQERVFAVRTIREGPFVAAFCRLEGKDASEE